MKLDLNSVLSSLGKAAEELAPMIVPGAGPLIALAHNISGAFVAAKVANGGTAPAAADAGHSALFTKVKTHSDDTFGRMEGG